MYEDCSHTIHDGGLDEVQLSSTGLVVLHRSMPVRWVSDRNGPQAVGGGAVEVAAKDASYQLPPARRIYPLLFA